MALAKELFEVNYFGTLRLIQAVLPSMKAKQKGHIINNSSLLGVYGVPFNELYCSTKFAMEGLTEALAPTLLHFNIRYSVHNFKILLKLSLFMDLPSVYRQIRGKLFEGHFKKMAGGKACTGDEGGRKIV